MKWWFRQPLHIQIFICIPIGIGIGLILSTDQLVYIKPIGDIFINLLMMLIVPLTFFTLITGITRLEDLRSLRSLGGKTILFYGITSFVASGLGIVIARILQPGKEAIGILGEAVEPKAFNLLEILVSWFPRNPIKALADGEMLQIITFAIIVGVGLILMGPKARRLITFIDDAAELMIRITELVMKTAPYGIFALVADMTAHLGGKMLKDVGRFILSDYLSMMVLLIILYPLLLQFVGKHNPLRFYRNIAPAILVAGSTTSSGATLPVSMKVAGDHLGLSEKIWGFTLPLGCTINMDGMAAAIGVIAVFATNLYDFSITPAFVIQTMTLGMILSIGTAGIKGAGIVMSGILLNTLGLPLTLIPVLAALWPILDIGHTICNVTGDLVGSTIIGNQMGLLDNSIFYGQKPLRDQ